MVVKYITPGGSRIHGPPYTQAEEDEFYRRIGGGPITIFRAADKTTNKKAQKSVAIKSDPDLPSDSPNRGWSPPPMSSNRTSYWRRFRA
jgi:hypothetical protein